MNNKKVVRWLRNVHRDLGYFFVGIIVIYAISGILLSHNINSYCTEHHTINLACNLSSYQLKEECNNNKNWPKLTKLMESPTGYKVFVRGGTGLYDINTGQLSIVIQKRNSIAWFVHQLHYNSIKGWKYIADFFAISLIFFAISGLFLSKGRKSISGRGKWILLAGVIIPILIFCFA